MLTLRLRFRKLSGCSSTRRGNDELDLGPLADPAVDLHPSAVSVHDALDDRQTETCVLLRSGTGGFDTVESFKDVRQMLRRDSAPRIRHGHPDILPARTRCKLDRATG